MTTVNQPLRGGRNRSSRPAPRRRLIGWGPALVSFALAVAYGLYIALRTYEVDLGVYLRLGGKYVFTSHLYSFVLPNTSLPFTYPPFAALLFAPWQRTFTSVGLVQTVWTMGNLAALIGVLVLSVRLVKPSLDRTSTWRLALALSLPALFLNPVLITIGFGQVNLFVTFLVMWDLLSERRIGKRQLPLGVATGLAAAVKLTPLLFVPYLLLTRRWRGAVTCLLTFGACELVTFAVSPASSRAYWTRAVFKPGRAGDLSIVDNQNLWGYSTVSRTASSPMPSCSLCFSSPPQAGSGSRRRRTDVRRRFGRLDLRGDVPHRVPDLVGPPHGVGRPGDSVARLARPAPLGTTPRGRHRRPLLERARLVGALQEHLRSPSQSSAAHRRKLLLLRHADLPGRRGILGAAPPPIRRCTADSGAPGRLSCRRRGGLKLCMRCLR